MKHLRFFMLTVFSAAFAVSLSACQTFEGMRQDFDSLSLPAMSSNGPVTPKNQKLVYGDKCPQVEAVEELKSLAEFSNPGSPSPDSLISKIDIANVQSTCDYSENNVTIDVRMDFKGTLGPQGRNYTGDKPFFSYPFFVAVTSAGGDILAKEIFAASLTYPPGANTQTYTEKLRQIIPIENQDRGSNYKVLIGLQLSPDQLAYNRQMLVAQIEAEKLKQKQLLAEKKRLEKQAELEKERQEQLRKQAEQQQPTVYEQQARDAQEQAQKQIYIGRPVEITP